MPEQYKFVQAQTKAGPKKAFLDQDGRWREVETGTFLKSVNGWKPLR